MPFTSREYWATLNSLRDQGYRRVLLEGIDPDVRLSTGDAQLDSALVKSKAAPNWGEIARQLLQFQGLSGFQFTCVRRDKHDIEIICAYAWNGQLSLNTAVTRANHVSVIMNQLEKIVNQFSLADETRALLESALNDNADAGTAPATPPAASPALANDPNLDAPPVGQPIPPGAAAPAPNEPSSRRLALEALALVWDFFMAERGNGVFLPVGGDGLSPDTTERLDRGLRQFALPTVGLDCIEKTIHGETYYSSFKVDRFNISYQSYMS